jgi:hypothetical protein
MGRGLVDILTQLSYAYPDRLSGIATEGVSRALHAATPRTQRAKKEATVRGSSLLDQSSGPEYQQANCDRNISAKHWI